MRLILTLIASVLLAGCATKSRVAEPTFNEKMLKAQIEKEKGHAQDEVVSGPSGDVSSASLWARSEGNQYLVRNLKAQAVGDLLTIIVDETASAQTSAKTDTKRDGGIEIAANLSRGQGSSEQIGVLGFTGDHKNDFKGEGTTDRSGRLQTTVQAVVENVLANGTLFVKGRKVITINNEDQEVEISGFVRPDNIRINNTVNSSVMADAKIRYVGDGVISDKQRVGWGTRLMDAIWPF